MGPREILRRLRFWLDRDTLSDDLDEDLTAFGVQQRTNEIGLRMALGARRGAVTSMIIRSVLWQGVMGIAAGVPAAFLAMRLVQSQLYGVSPADPTQAAVAAVVLLLAVLLAGYLPARRASRIDPVRALRQE